MRSLPAAAAALFRLMMGWWRCVRAKSAAASHLATRIDDARLLGRIRLNLTTMLRSRLLVIAVGH
jgi:hypothetical protein